MRRKAGDESYNAVFMRRDFGEMLNQIEKQFETDMWGTLIQYEWNETGESSVFYLMLLRSAILRPTLRKLVIKFVLFGYLITVMMNCKTLLP